MKHTFKILKKYQVPYSWLIVNGIVVEEHTGPAWDVEVTSTPRWYEFWAKPKKDTCYGRGIVWTASNGKWAGFRMDRRINKFIKAK